MGWRILVGLSRNWMRSAASDWCEIFAAFVCQIIVALFLTISCRCFIVQVMMGGRISAFYVALGIGRAWRDQILVRYLATSLCGWLRPCLGRGFVFLLRRNFAVLSQATLRAWLCLSLIRDDYRHGKLFLPLCFCLFLFTIFDHRLIVLFYRRMVWLWPQDCGRCFLLVCFLGGEFD